MKKSNNLTFIDKVINLEYTEETFFLNYYRLTDCLRKLEFDSSHTNCLALLNNNQNVLKLIKYMFNKNKDDILLGNFTNFTKDLILINLIIAYCDCAQIEIKKKKINIKHLANPVLTSKEEIALFDLYKMGNREAMDIIILRNLNLVRHFSYKFAEKYEIKDIHTINDMISYGTIGLYDALNAFEASKGKFTTYASIKIMSQIISYLKYNNHVIKKSKSYTDRKTYLDNKENELTVILGRKPTIEEFSNYVGYSQTALKKFDQKALTIVDAYIKTDNEEINIIDNIESPDSIEQELSKSEIIVLFQKCKLTKCQMKYLMHYCFDKMSYPEIGRLYDITYQAVQNNIKYAIIKIKNSEYGQNYLSQVLGNKFDDISTRKRTIN